MSCAWRSMPAEIGHRHPLQHARAEGLRFHDLRHSAVTILLAAAVPERRSTILCFQADWPEVTERLYKKLQVNQVIVSLRHGMIRVSPYLYNTESDIDHLLEIIK